MFPTPVMEIIGTSLPWTLGLLTFSLFLSWVIGNFIGGVAGYFPDKKWSKVLSMVSITIYPIPYYIMALILVVLFGYLIPIFPIFGGLSVGTKFSFSLNVLVDMAKHSFLPALSLTLIWVGWWFLSMRALSSSVRNEDYVQYAEVTGIPKRKILFGYVMKNCLLPQYTSLALRIGGAFSGALVTEYLFSYPGLGRVLYQAIMNGDFNLMMGIVILSMVVIASASLILDFIYPFIDPRIRYG